jgi:hypothetical protein
MVQMPGGPMHPRLLAAAVAATSLLVVPHPASAQHRGHSSGHGQARPAPSTSGSRAANLHAPPYYLFRERENLRFGLYLGYPSGYPYYYFAPGGYLDPYSYSPIRAYSYGSSVPTDTWPLLAYPLYGYSAFDSNAVTSTPVISPPQNAPRSTSTGEVRFRVTPDTAAVFMDGAHVGAANDYSTTTALALETGRHHFELGAPGYQTLAFDLDVRPGRVVQYRATLQRAPQ